MVLIISSSGGWWHTACEETNLNGKYIKSSSRGKLERKKRVLYWKPQKGRPYFIKSTKLMIHSTDFENFDWASPFGVYLIKHIIPLSEPSESTFQYSGERIPLYLNDIFCFCGRHIQKNQYGQTMGRVMEMEKCSQFFRIVAGSRNPLLASFP